MKNSYLLKENLIYLWIYPKTGEIEFNTKNELSYSKDLSYLRSYEFRLSRSLLRKSLGHLFNKDCLGFSINAKPGTRPYLENERGFISISHTKTLIVIGYSLKNIGIDIEEKDRKIKKDTLVNKIFTEDELLINKINNPNEILKYWTIKEAAIKWSNGSIFKNMKDWYLIKNQNLIVNKKLNKELYLKTLDLYNSYISICYQKENFKMHLMVCDYISSKKVIKKQN